MRVKTQVSDLDREIKTKDSKEVMGGDESNFGILRAGHLWSIHTERDIVCKNRREI